MKEGIYHACMSWEHWQLYAHLEFVLRRSTCKPKVHSARSTTDRTDGFRVWINNIPRYLVYFTFQIDNHTYSGRELSEFIEKSEGSDMHGYINWDSTAESISEQVH